MKLDIVKKALNTKIKDYNDRLAELREEEKLLRKKKETLKRLEIANEKLVTDELYDEGIS